MNGYKGKHLADTVSAAGSMILFLIFAVCTLVIITAAAAAYSRISDSFGNSFSSSAAVKYLSNKIRSSDECEIGGNGLILRSGEICCVIWCENGGIYEKTASGQVPEKQGGDKIFEADSLGIYEENGIYSISVSCGKENSAVLLRKG